MRLREPSHKCSILWGYRKAKRLRGEGSDDFVADIPRFRRPKTYRADGIRVANPYRISSRYSALVMAFCRSSHLFRPGMEVGPQNLHSDARAMHAEPAAAAETAKVKEAEKHQRLQNKPEPAWSGMGPSLLFGGVQTCRRSWILRGLPSLHSEHIAAVMS